MEEWVKLLASAIGGAGTASVLLWYKFKSYQQRLKEKDQLLNQQQQTNDLVTQSKEHDLRVKGQIDSEAEWMRIIQYRDNELIRLRDKDEQQEKKISDLYEKHLGCQKSEAAQGERIKMLEERDVQAAAERAANKREIAELRSLLITLKEQGKVTITTIEPTPTS